MGKGIKTRVSEKKGIKAIDNAAVASERMKEAYIRTKSIFPKACCVCVLKCFDLGLAYRGDSRSFGCASVIPYDDRPGVSNLFAP